MRYSVIVSPEAQKSIQADFLFIRDNASAVTAKRWLSGLAAAIDSLEKMPARCPLIREQGNFRTEYRAYYHFNHRLIFAISEETKAVQVVAFRHGCRDDVQDL